MRPLFTVHAGEFLVGQHIEASFKDKNVWVPTKDGGVDLLVTNLANTKTVTLQVKFSRDFLPIMKLEPSVLKQLKSCNLVFSGSKENRSVCSGLLGAGTPGF
jgi:hypothetical protein